SKECGYFLGQGVGLDGEFLGKGVQETYRPGFDCKEAETPVETTLCHDELLAQADWAMGEAYSKLLSDDPFAKSDVALKRQQLAWLRKRNECNNSREVAPCLVGSYAKRIAELRAKAKGPAVPKTIPFQDYVKNDLDSSKDALWKDPMIRLL